MISKGQISIHICVRPHVNSNVCAMNLVSVLYSDTTSRVNSARRNKAKYVSLGRFNSALRRKAK